MSKNEFDSKAGKVPFELFNLVPAGKQPAIVIVYGTAGMLEPYGTHIRSFAGDLAARGFVILLPNHFHGTGTSAGFDAYQAFPQKRDIWVSTLNDCVRYAKSRDDVKDGKIGLLGFSMGGHLALRTAKLTGGSKVNALVEFFAPIKQEVFRELGTGIESLPFLQIHHGTADETVKPAETAELVRLLKAAKKKEGADYEVHWYDGEGHGFRNPADSKSRQLTGDFFDKHLR